MKYLKLLRFPNLIIIAITQYLVRYSLITAFDVEHALTNFQFLLLVISTVCIAAAGNAINDYFDVKVDKINKQAKVVVGTVISRSRTIAIHMLLSGIGVVIAFYLSFILKIYWFGFIHLAAATALYFYSTHFKKQFVLGNVLVSLLTAQVVLLVALYELVPVDGPVFEGESNDALILIIAYSCFSFIVSWIREIVKDLEDLSGDKEVGYKTMAVSWGIKKSKGFITALTILMLMGIVFISLSEFATSPYALLYIGGAIILPTILFLLVLKRATAHKQFGHASSVAKVIMLLGAGSMLYFATLVQNGIL